MQFEDFANRNAFELQSKYGTTHLFFNDDILVCGIGLVDLITLMNLVFLPKIFLPLLQGTASVVLTGLVGALKLLGGTLAEHTFYSLVLGK